MTHPYGHMYASKPTELVRLPNGITWPVKYAAIRRFQTNHTFGMVRRRSNGSARPHQGWDFYAPEGYRCYAIADGTAVAVRDRGAFGRHVILKFQFDLDRDGSKDTLFAAYCHLSRVDVKRGQRLKRGDQIGLTGNTGNAGSMRGSDRHLHFEIRTRALPGLGLFGRMSPMAVFGMIPMRSVMVTDPALID